MLAKILGFIWILAGLLWIIKPEILKNRLKKKMNRKMKWPVHGFILVFGFLLIGSVIKAEGLLPKLIGLIGMLIAIRAILWITSKTSEKILDWWAEKPLSFFRLWALFIFGIGVLLLYV